MEVDGLRQPSDIVARSFPPSSRCNGCEVSPPRAASGDLDRTLPLVQFTFAVSCHVVSNRSFRRDLHMP
jgi:hypothetical protein